LGKNIYKVKKYTIYTLFKYKKGSYNSLSEYILKYK
jgi:hypothetical protein